LDVIFFRVVPQATQPPKKLQPTTVKLTESLRGVFIDRELTIKGT
jgi:hypothetical protein